MKTYIINLKESHKRRQHILGEVAKYPLMDVELVEAVDGRALSEEERNRQFDCKGFEWRYKRKLKPGEVGCTLSHRLCYQKLLDSKEEVALIIEDDVHFLPEEQVENVIVAGERLIAHKEACIVLLEPNIVHYVPGNCLIENFSYYRVYEAMSAFAYLINRKAAARILSRQKPSIVADDYTFFFRKGIHILAILPAIATVIDVSSLIRTPKEKFSYKEQGRGLLWILYYRIRNLLFVKIKKIKIKLGWLKANGYYE